MTGGTRDETEYDVNTERNRIKYKKADPRHMTQDPRVNRHRTERHQVGDIGHSTLDMRWLDIIHEAYDI